MLFLHRLDQLSITKLTQWRIFPLCTLKTCLNLVFFHKSSSCLRTFGMMKYHEKCKIIQHVHCGKISALHKKNWRASQSTWCSRFPCFMLNNKERSFSTKHVTASVFFTLGFTSFNNSLTCITKGKLSMCKLKIVVVTFYR